MCTCRRIPWSAGNNYFTAMEKSGWHPLSESNIQVIYYTCQNISASVCLLGWGLLWAASPSLPFTITPCHSQDRTQHRATKGAQAAPLGGSRWCFELDEQGSEHMRLGMELEGNLGTGNSSWAVEPRAPVPPTAEPVLPSAGGCCYIQILGYLLQCLGPDPCSDLSRLHITSSPTQQSSS